jgi:hypothetical protein
MNGQIYSKLNELFSLVHGDPIAYSYVKTKLMLKGIDPDDYNEHSEDNPKILLIVEKFIYTLSGGKKQ